jgi:HD-GYP domain-containing protein (c-di-GMP phosphodiesterase class II)
MMCPFLDKRHWRLRVLQQRDQRDGIALMLIPFVPPELRHLLTSSLGYAQILERHSMRTAMISRRIGTTMRLPGSELEILISAAYLHDFGKLFIPITVLNKPSRLTTAEYRIIQQHPETGRQCVGAFPGYERISIIVGQHHERMDGRGYPHRRPGHTIDLLARVLAVADAYCAMTEARPYQHALAPIAAVVRIWQCAGTQFDPGVVDALVESDLILPNITVTGPYKAPDRALIA